MFFKKEAHHVEGERKGDIMLYALSTCGWCKKTKGMLDDMGVEYSYVNVDLLEEEERKEALKQIKIHNPKCSFPTMVINDDDCIVGFKEQETREALEIGK